MTGSNRLNSHTAAPPRPRAAFWQEEVNCNVCNVRQHRIRLGCLAYLASTAEVCENWTQVGWNHESEMAEMLLSHGTPQKNNNAHPKRINLLVFPYVLCACDLLCTEPHHLPTPEQETPSELPTKLFRASSASSALRLRQRVPWCWSITGLCLAAAWVVAFVTGSVAHLLQRFYVPAGMESCFLPCVFRGDRQGYAADF